MNKGFFQSLKESKKEIDPMTQMTYEFYKRKQSEE